jgi:hypothetical protein
MTSAAGPGCRSRAPADSPGGSEALQVVVAPARAGSRPRTPRHRRRAAPGGGSRCSRPGRGRCRAGGGSGTRRSRPGPGGGNRRTGCDRSPSPARPCRCAARPGRTGAPTGGWWSCPTGRARSRRSCTGSPGRRTGPAASASSLGEQPLQTRLQVSLEGLHVARPAPARARAAPRRWPPPAGRRRAGPGRGWSRRRRWPPGPAPRHRPPGRAPGRAGSPARVMQVHPPPGPGELRQGVGRGVGGRRQRGHVADVEPAREAVLRQDLAALVHQDGRPDPGLADERPSWAHPAPRPPVQVSRFIRSAPRRARRLHPDQPELGRPAPSAPPPGAARIRPPPPRGRRRVELQAAAPEPPTPRDASPCG